MRTAKPISTISYNTEAFLHNKLQELYDNDIIEFYCYIHHDPEDDECNLKEHFHVYVEPNKLIDTKAFRHFFNEDDPYNKIPKKCLKFDRSKVGDWMYYGLHDEEYLASKDMERVYHYKFENFVSSDSDDLLYKFKTIDMTDLSPYKGIKEAIKSGLTFQEYFRKGTVPLNQISNVQAAWNLLKNPSGKTKRANHAGHDSKEELDD